MGTDDLVTSTAVVGDSAVVSVTGDVDLTSSGHLGEVLREAIQEADNVVVDFAGLSFIDSSGLSALVDAHRRTRDGGGTLTLRHPTAMLRRLLDITRLDTLLMIDPPEPGSVESGDRS
jgi:anti-sigma B factor antagonist